MLRYANTAGGYHYHPQSWFMVLGDVPLYIPLAWGFIISTSMRLTDQLGIKAWARPFADALLALLIDASLDAVAIRLKFWYWHGVSLDDAFFGVPADNFLGWLLVTFTFSLLTRGLWGKNLFAVPLQIVVQGLLLPPVAYLLYLLLEWPVHGVYTIARAESQRAQLVVLTGVLLLFAALFCAGITGSAERAEDNIPPADRFSLHTPRHAFHLFGVIGLMCLSPALRSAGLWLLSVGVWISESSIAYLAHRQSKEQV